ncbi:hypothetical protein AB0C04_01790 [Micromonospora sp. NPDC048909]|uniref:hypothetical protein n=1 Tax=Micromonospora sp. NPDC048909 TaxID=3155643 RepID=UPI0033DE76EF
MDELVEQLRASVDGAPPTRIDVDELIAADRQRRRHRTWTMAGTGIAAAVAAVAVAPALLAGPGPAPGGLTLPPVGTGSSADEPSLCPVLTPKPSGPQPPLQTYDTVRSRPTESPNSGVARLTGALRPALAANLPPGLTVDGFDGLVPDCELVQFTYHPSYREYSAHARLVEDGRSTNFTVSLLPTAVHDPTDCAVAPDPRGCTSEVLDDDGVLIVSVDQPGDQGHEQRRVLLQRPDGTSVVVSTNNFPAGPSPDGPGGGTPLMVTVDQLVAIARTPGLTLYP